MVEPPAEPDRTPPRFPFVAALLCAGCIGAAAWTWIRFSYTWPVAPKDLAVKYDEARTSPWIGRYVCISGVVWQARPTERVAWIGPEGNAHSTMAVPVQPIGSELLERVPTEVEGRVRLFMQPGCRGPYVALLVDATASRFHGASVFGLVVGAMGVFVFAAALRHWMRRAGLASGRPAAYH